MVQTAEEVKTRTAEKLSHNWHAQQLLFYRTQTLSTSHQLLPTYPLCVVWCEEDLRRTASLSTDALTLIRRPHRTLTLHHDQSSEPLPVTTVCKRVTLKSEPVHQPRTAGGAGTHFVWYQTHTCNAYVSSITCMLCTYDTFLYIFG